MLHTIDREIISPAERVMSSRIMSRRTFDVIERYRRMLRSKGWRVHTATVTDLGTGAVTYYICADKIVLGCNCKVGENRRISLQKSRTVR